MKLLFSPTSPYVRKVRALIIEKQLEDQVEMVTVVTTDLPDNLLDANPLARIPTLILDDGSTLFDSRVIMEYLDSLGRDAGARSGQGEGVWAVKHLHAWADGILDSIFIIAMERRRPENERSPAYIEKQLGKIERGIAGLDAKVSEFSEIPNLGEIAVACCLGYADLRLSHDLDWRASNPVLAAWFSGISTRPSISETTPPA